MKYLPDCWVIFLEQNIISATISMVTIVSCQLSMHMLKNTETMVMALDTSCGMLWLSIWRRVSTSLVYTDMMSPWGCWSKYLMGRLSIWVNSWVRRLRRVPCVTLTMMRALSHAARMPIT